MRDHFHIKQKVIITDSSHEYYGHQFEVYDEDEENIFLIKEGTTLGFSVLPTQIRGWQPYDSLEETKAIDYSSYSEMDDLVVNERDAFVISNDTEKKEILIEYVDSGEMETIDYSKPIESPKSEPKVPNSRRFISVQQALDTTVDKSFISSGTGKVREATDKEFKEIQLSPSWNYDYGKHDGWSVFFLHGNRDFVFKTKAEAEEYISKKGLNDISDQIMSEGGKVIRIDNRVDVSRWIYYNKKFENYTDKELKKYNGNNHAMGNWNRKDAIYEAVETAMKKPYEKGGSIKKNGYFTGELSFLNW